jgi:hypothetical protein
MRLSFAIRAALIAFTVSGVGLATAAYADIGAIRFNGSRLALSLAPLVVAACWYFTAGVIHSRSAG